MPSSLFLFETFLTSPTPVTLCSPEVNSQRNETVGLYKLATWPLRKFNVIIVLLYADSWAEKHRTPDWVCYV